MKPKGRGGHTEEEGNQYQQDNTNGSRVFRFGDGLSLIYQCYFHLLAFISDQVTLDPRLSLYYPAFIRTLHPNQLPEQRFCGQLTANGK
jgi:hypothetical protein